MSEQRVTELEIKVAYQEDLLTELNKIVCHQQLQLDRLTTTCTLLAEQIKNVSMEKSHTPLSAQDEIPPHY